MLRSFLLSLSLVFIISLQPFQVSAKEELGSKGKSSASEEPTKEELVFDFGHVAVDFKLFHTFLLVNRSQKLIKITGVHVPCDCSAVTALDSLVQPGDTGFFRLTYSTKDDFGTTNRSFQVHTDYPKMSEVRYTYKSIVEQWLDGLKPHPTSLFFLPAHKSKKVTILNTVYDEISLAGTHQYDTSFVVTLLRDKAAKGKALELEIAPRSSLKKGSYGSNLTLRVKKSNEKDPTILTIPIKIVRY